MSRERRDVEISFIVNKPEHLPLKDGEQMYADDVVQEFREFLGPLIDLWYEGRGRELLDHEPMW